MGITELVSKGHGSGWRWLRHRTLLAGVLAASWAHAQNVSLYSFSSSTGGTLDAMSGSSVLIGPGQDDVSSSVNAIGFDLVYEGSTYTQFSVNSNGGMRLGGTAITSSAIWNLTQTGNEVPLLPFSADGGTANGSVSTRVEGSAPNRIRLVQWNVGIDYNAASTNCIFQVWLYEGSNVIEFRYGAGAPSGGGAPDKLVAIGGATSANFINVRPGPVGSVSDASPLNAWPGDGTVFTFTPPAPCTPPPAPGNTLAAAYSGCPGFSTTLSLQNATAGSGVSYQWQSSPTGAEPWTNVGSSAASHGTGTLLSTTWYRCLVTCATGPSTVASNPIQIVVSDPAATYFIYTGAQVNEAFGSWGNRCSTGDVPSSGSNHWKNSPAFGAGTWRASNTTQGAAGWNNVSGGFTSTTVASNPNSVAITYPAARFHSRQGASVVGTLDFHVDMSAATGSEFLRFEYINSAGNGNLGVWVSTNGGSSFSQIGATLTTTAINTWETKQFTIGSTSATTVIRLRGTAGAAASGNDIGVDNFRIIPAAACTAPTAPAASVVGVGSVDVNWTCASCTGSFFVEYGAPGFALGTGIVAGPFTGSTASITGLPNGNYQCYVRQNCGVAGLSSNAGPVSFSIVAGDFCANAINLAVLPNVDWSVVASSANANNDITTSACQAGLTGRDVLLYHDVEVGATLSLGLWSSANRMAVAYGGACPGAASLACSAGGYFTPGPYVQMVNDYQTLIWTNTGCSTERVYVLADALGAGGGDVYVFNYAYTPAGGGYCASVNGVAATVTSSNSVSVAWSAPCSGDVVVEYGPQGFSPGTAGSAGGGTAVAASGTSAVLSGLVMNTPYDVYVRQDCGGGVYSGNGTAVPFIIVAGENCAVAIDLATESAPLIASTMGAANDFNSVGCGASGGGDLIYSLTVPADATVTFEALHDYSALVQVSYGASCPGTVLTCGPGLDQYEWTNTTGDAQVVYWLQDGTASGDFLLNWSVYDPCQEDADNDGLGDCVDSCPNFPGQNGDFCDANPGPGYTLGQITACACVPVVCTTNLNIIFNPDGVTNIQWEIRQQGSNVLVQSGGGVYPPTPEYSEATCLPNGDYYLVVTSNTGGIVQNGYQGGYRLRTAGGLMVVDNRNNFLSGSTSQIAGGEGFSIPLSSDRTIFTSSDKLDWQNNEYIYATDNPTVTAQYGVNNANSGYQMWWYNPNGGYSFRRFQNHNTSNGLPASATRACGFKINSWSGNQLQDGTLYNVKVRSMVNGTYGNWGAATRFRIDAVRAQCPLTNLMDIPGNQFVSCGGTRALGTSQPHLVHARPVKKLVNGAWVNANRYQFRFISENTIIKTSNTNQYWVYTGSAPSLAAGVTYEVEVRASFDNGATWCDAAPGLNPFAPKWGKVCLLTISGAAQGGNQNMAAAANNAEVSLYPNPNNGQQLTLSLSQVEAGTKTVTVDILDTFGKRVSARTIAVNDTFVNTVLDLNGELAAGMYLVNITAGANTYTERLVIQP